MAVLTATEKLKILALGKATLKEINELEALAEKEPKEEPPKEEPPKEEPPKEEPPKEEPDEKDKRIAELEAQLKEAQADNVHGNNETPNVSFEEQLNDMFKDIRI